MSPQAELEAAVASLKEFRLVREIGRGGMGAVFLAEEQRLQRPVAIKMLLRTTTDDADGAQRFLREARTAASLAHPHIVSILRAEEADERLFIVMPYVDGDTLAAKLRQRGPLPAQEVAQVLREVAWALGYAHSRGIIHRDIKPENIIIERGSSRALVADFGIAQHTGLEAITRSGVMVGTVHYMSPEQANGGPLTGASDLYALGVTGYYALTGEHPIDGPSAAAVLVRHATVTPKPLRSLRPDVPEDLAYAIDRCLAKSPADRYPSAEAFADALAAAAGTRTEIPARVRAWIGRGNLVVPIVSLQLLAGWIGMPASVRLFADGLQDFTVQKLVFVVLYFAGGISWYFFLYAVLVEPFGTRGLARSGFGLEDIRYGLRSDLRQRIEERQSASDRRSATRTLLRLATALLALWFVISTSVLINALIENPIGESLNRIILLFGALVLTVWFLSRVLGLDVLLRRLRLRLWSGRIGARLFRLATFRR